MGLELERRIVAKRITRPSEAGLEEFFSLRSDGPDVTTPDGVVLHTEVDEGAEDDLTLVYVHGYALNLDCWHFQRLHFRGRLRGVFYDQRSHGRSSRSEAERCRIRWPRTCTRFWRRSSARTSGSHRALDGRDDDHATRPVSSSSSAAVCWGRAVLHIGWELTDHSPIRGIPGRTFHRVAEPLMAV